MTGRTHYVYALYAGLFSIPHICRALYAGPANISCLLTYLQRQMHFIFAEKMKLTESVLYW